MSCIQIYIYAIRIERALSLQIIISFHRNGTFNLLFAHMFRCVLRPLLEVLTTVFLSTVIFERTLHNLSIALFPSISLAQSAQKLTTVSIGPSFASITCIRHKMKKAATWTDAQAAQRWRCKQVAFLPAFLIFSPTDVARWIRWIQRGGSNCRERPKQEKISSTFMPDFLPGASVQKRASQCTLSSVYMYSWDCRSR